MGDIRLDLSSSYFEGATCPLAQFGASRDAKKGKSQVNYGLSTDARGCPVSVYAGNTADPQSLLPEIGRLRNDFGIAQRRPDRQHRLWWQLRCRAELHIGNRNQRRELIHTPLAGWQRDRRFRELWS